MLQVVCVETPFMASHPFEARPRHGIPSLLRAVRAVSDAMNRISTWRMSNPTATPPRVAHAATGLTPSFLAPTPPHGPPREENVVAGLRPELWAAEMPPLLSRPGGERRDESHFYVADVPAGGIWSCYI